MSEYHKIPNVFKRDPETKFKTLIDGSWGTPELELLADCPFTGQEKIDGTNIRVIWDGHAVEIRGRTDRAQMLPELHAHLLESFPEGAMEDQFGETPAVLYGEGFGRKIQKGGGDYCPDGVRFALFDVRCGDMWLTREAVSDVARGLACPEAPTLGTKTLREWVDFVRGGFDSELKSTPPEGVIVRPVVELRSRRGQRVIAKIKGRDFAS